MRSVLVLSLVAAAAALPTPMDAAGNALSAAIIGGADLSFLNGPQKGDGKNLVSIAACRFFLTVKLRSGTWHESEFRLLPPSGHSCSNLFD